MKREKVTRTRPRTLAELTRENASLRKELSRLEVFRTLAYRDPLTGLWNRRYFEERWGEELSRAERTPDRQVSVMVIDVNDLKVINDVHGHPTGDRVLAWVATFLRSGVRAHDVCCRTGGDEFAVILPDVGRDGREMLIGRLRRALVDANSVQRPNVGLSIGAVSYPTDGRGAEELIERADAAMYHDKRTQKEKGEHTPLPVTMRPAFMFDT